MTDLDAEAILAQDPLEVYRSPQISTENNDQVTLEAIFNRFKPATIFEIVRGGQSVASDIASGPGKRVVCLRLTGGEGEIRGPAAGIPLVQQQVQYMAVDSTMAIPTKRVLVMLPVSSGC